MTSKEGVPGTQALTKGIHVLRAIAAEGRKAYFADLMKTTGFPKPTLYRILKALISEGLIRHEPKDGSYHLGISFLRLALQVLKQLDIREVAHEDMIRLSDTTGEAVHLAILDGTSVLYVDAVESTHPVGPTGRLGTQSTLHASASGKAIAANLSSATMTRILKALELTKFTSKTISSLDRLQKNFEHIRKCGYATNEEEEAEGIHGVAAPIFNLAGEVVGSVAVSIPSYRFQEDRMNFYADAVKSAAKSISSRLGKMD